MVSNLGRVVDEEFDCVGEVRAPAQPEEIVGQVLRNRQKALIDQPPRGQSCDKNSDLGWLYFFGDCCGLYGKCRLRPAAAGFEFSHWFQFHFQHLKNNVAFEQREKFCPVRPHPGKYINSLIIVWIYRWKSPPAPLFQIGELPPFDRGRSGGICSYPFGSILRPFIKANSACDQHKGLYSCALCRAPCTYVSQRTSTGWSTLFGSSCWNCSRQLRQSVTSSSGFNPLILAINRIPSLIDSS